MSESKPSGGRRFLLGVLGVATCVVITLAATTLWINQVALNTDRYVTVVTRVATNPEVVDEVTARLADQIVDEFDVPRLVKPLIQDWIQEQVAAFMDTDLFSDAWGAANRAAHTVAVRVLRGGTRLDSSDGELTINVLPALIIALERLREVGILPDDFELPDPSDIDAAAVVREALAERLGINLPPNIGELPLVRMSRLESVRQVVHVFDLVTVASIVLAVVLAAATLWLSRNRRKTVLYLGVGTAIVVVVVQLLALVLSNAVATSMADDGTPILGAILGALISNLALALTVVLGLAVAAAVASAVVGRRAEVSD